MHKLHWIIYAVLMLGCTSNHPQIDTSITLTQADATNLLQLPLKCANQEYPNKLNQVLQTAADLKSPKQLHPGFYGCFDWHSSVHGHWSLVRLLKNFPDLKDADQARQVLANNITPSNIQADIDYFEKNPSWERPYGWAWLLKLSEELETWDDPLATELRQHIKPLAEKISALFVDHLPKLVYPIRVGKHTNTAFGLAFAWDYAKFTGDQALLDAVTQRARDYFLRDRNCPIHWEPSGYDFLSPCLEEIDLMRRVLPADEFHPWLRDFLPALTRSSFTLPVGQVSDRKDGKLVHLDGLNFSRAWVLFGLANQYPRYAHLKQVAQDHVEHSLPHLVGDSYEGGHWLASFAIYAMDSNTQSKPEH